MKQGFTVTTMSGATYRVTYAPRDEVLGFLRYWPKGASLDDAATKYFKITDSKVATSQPPHLTPWADHWEDDWKQQAIPEVGYEWYLAGSLTAQWIISTPVKTIELDVNQ